MLQIGEELAVRIRPLVRDELEETLRSKIYASYSPATEKGKVVKNYNETHTHQQTHPYHHTGLLLRNIRGVIEGNSAVVKVFPEQYENGTTTSEVYDYLKYGTPEKPKKAGVDSYYFDHKQSLSPYIQQLPHDFEKETAIHMDRFLSNLANEISTKNKNGKYTDKVKERNIAKYE